MLGFNSNRKMKKVIKEQPEKTTNIVNVNDSKYYGVQTIAAVRGFTTMTNFRQHPYMIKSINCITQGNGWEMRNISLQNLLEECILRGWTVYEFDSAKELFTWLLEVEK